MPWPEMSFSSGFNLNVTAPNVILISFVLMNVQAPLTNLMVTSASMISVVLLSVTAPDIILHCAVLLNVMVPLVEQLGTVVCTIKIF